VSPAATGADVRHTPRLDGCNSYEWLLLPGSAAAWAAHAPRTPGGSPCDCESTTFGGDRDGADGRSCWFASTALSGSAALVSEWIPPTSPGMIIEIDAVLGPELLAHLDFAVLDDWSLTLGCSFASWPKALFARAGSAWVLKTGAAKQLCVESDDHRARRHQYGCERRWKQNALAASTPAASGIVKM
jgi:hypothetical protein